MQKKKRKWIDFLYAGSGSGTILDFIVTTRRFFSTFGKQWTEQRNLLCIGFSSDNELFGTTFESNRFLARCYLVIAVIAQLEFPLVELKQFVSLWVCFRYEKGQGDCSNGGFSSYKLSTHTHTLTKMIIACVEYDSSRAQLGGGEGGPTANASITVGAHISAPALTHAYAQTSQA